MLAHPKQKIYKISKGWQYNMVKVAINGFGRIGRLVLRIGIKEGIEFPVINDLTDAPTLAHLLKYDSVHGQFDGSVEVEGNSIIVNGKKIDVIAEKDPSKLPWGAYGIDIVVESTGLFTNKADIMKHISAGAKKVLLSAPAKDEVETCVIGATSDLSGKQLISNASCTTNSLVPVAMVLDKEFGIESGFMTTVHAYTNDQRVLDLPHKDLRRARAAAVNIIPTSTGAAKTVGNVLPQLKGKLDGLSLRVPVPCGSISDFTCILKKEASVKEINDALKNASNTYLKGVMQYTEDQIVSSDILGNTHSSIIDASLTMANGKLVKVCAWYDNEYGFSCRMVDMLKLMAKG